jgi:acetyl esterase/lipase
MRQILITLFSYLLLASVAVHAEENKMKIMTADELGSFGNPPADVRIPYGDDQFQFADLRLPEGPGPHPVIILIHGGCWLAEYDIVHSGKLAAGFASNGIATWSLEYRRIGNKGGAWPGTFQDIGKGADHLLKVAEKYSLDTNRIIVSGHSAGGHLALWLAARNQFPNSRLFSSENPVPLQGVLALAPAADLVYLHESGACDDVVDKLMEGSPQTYPDRYAQASIPELVPLGVPQILVIGRYDENWRKVGYRYLEVARAAGDQVDEIDAPESGHFEMIDPDSTTWPLVLGAARELLGIK